LKIAAGLLALIALILAIDAFVIEPRRLVVRHATLQLPRWPAALDGLSIVAVGDIHAGAPYINQQYLEKLVQTINQQQPDLVVLLGDYVIQEIPGGTYIEPEVIASKLKPLHAPLGVYAVLGNHDVWGDAVRIRRALESVGIRVLKNSAVEVKANGAVFWLAGIDDFFTGHSDVGSALKRIPSDSTIVAVTHDPDVFPEIPSRVTLTLAAHTHGGQVALPIVGRLIVPSKYGQRYAIGHIREAGHDMYVTTGIGTSTLPVRFRVPPEIAVIRLRH
jgi:predicted MPP superfamily phosphohydrolase